MTNSGKIDLKTAIAGLPSDLREAVFSEDIVNKITAIGKKYSLAIDKIGELDDETMNVIAGLTKPGNYTSNLQKRLAVDSETARKIAAEINAQIFAPIKESLKKIHEIKNEEQLTSDTLTTNKKVSEQMAPNKLATNQQPEVSSRKLEVKGRQPAAGPSPFEQKLEGEVFGPPLSVKKETAEAKKEQRYPGGEDPYKESVDGS
jgi:hypothetical protein